VSLSNPYRAIESGGPGRIGWRIHYLDEADSTQRVAANLAEDGAAHGTVVIAERQSAGRGRLGRGWHSPPGVNLYTTVILRPTMPVAEVPQLSLVAGAAVAETFESAAPGLVGLKWPNDIWLRGLKAGGMIAEAVTDNSVGLVCVLLGIGLNLNLAWADIPVELKDKATSVLIATGRTCERVQFAARLFNSLGTFYKKFEVGRFAAVRQVYERYFALFDRSVTVIDGSWRTAGVVRGIDHDGSLLLETTRGLTRIVTGDVSLEGAYD